MVNNEWLSKYESVKEKLACKVNLENYFTEKQIGKMNVDILEVGSVNFPTGMVVACDPLVDLEEASPYIQKVPVGTYPVKICVVPSDKYGDRYACVKVEVSDKKPIRYELGMTGNENFDEELEDGEYFGFFVDAGMGCFTDMKTQEEYKRYWQKLYENDDNINPYDDLFCDALEESYNNNPKYQRSGGDWANWTVPETDGKVVLFASGWGDGVYPCYFGYDENNDVCGIYILFIDIEKEFDE